VICKLEELKFFGYVRIVNKRYIRVSNGENLLKVVSSLKSENYILIIYTVKLSNIIFTDKSVIHSKAKNK
jgi:hypothetical protein